MKIPRVKREMRLKTLFQQLALDLGAISTTDAAKAFAVTRFSERMRKRAEIFNPCLEDEAKSKFIALNSSLKEIENQVCIDERIVQNASIFIRHVLERYCKSLYPESLQECYSRSFILDNWSFGPGTSNGVQGTGTVEKIDAKMTVTGSAVPFARQIRCLSPYFQYLDVLNGNVGLALVEGSKLAVVLKNETAMRTIAIEPSGNMAVQLSGGKFIEGAMRAIGLDIRTQQMKNITLAQLGSLYGTLATEDLTSASDMFLPLVIRSVWPQEWYRFFMETRSPICSIDGTNHELNMISTMGNGYTFPMMTLTLLALVYANRYVFHSGPSKRIDWNVTGVFGDDIIVPVTEVATLNAVLASAGLIVNHAKSYSSGPFRESCGGDFYNGVNVTPPYIKRLTQPADIYVAINQILGWCGRHELPLPRSLKYLFSLLDGKVFFVPEWMSDTSGVRTAQCARSFKHLMPKLVKKPYKGIFTLPLASGGFIESSGDGALYSPRLNSMHYKVGISKLPKGYLDGWDPLYGTWRASAYRSLMVSLTS